jgi:hypothetical protein
MAYDANKDSYKLFQHDASSTARKVISVTTSDATDLTIYAKALYIGVAGDISVLPVGQESSVVFKNHPVGYFVGCQVRRVNATGTTASQILALYD